MADTPQALYIGIGVAEYDDAATFHPLPGAVGEIEQVGAMLPGDRYQTRTLPNPTWAQVQEALDQWLPPDGLAPGGSLLLLWAGHGESRPEGLHLIARNVRANQSVKISETQLIGPAVHSGAAQILIILDTCYAGAGVMPALDLSDKIQQEMPPSGGDGNRWVGIVASAQNLEPARDGVFAQRLLKLLREGPSDPGLRLRWSVHNALIRGDDLIDALQKEWDASVTGQKPKVVQSGSAWFMFPNPLHQPEAPDRLSGYLLIAARGVEPGESGDYFTGRIAPLRTIVDWLNERRPGVMVVTGPPGAGKSALLGRICRWSDPAQRALLLAERGNSPAEPDPGANAVQGWIELHGLSVDQAAARIDALLIERGLLPPDPAGPRRSPALCQALCQQGIWPTLVLDGLDEAGSAAWDIAENLIRPLAERALLLVGTRELAGRPRSPEMADANAPPEKSLIQSIGAAHLLDLGTADLQAQTREDVRDYIVKRLAGKSTVMDPERVARVWIERMPADDEGAFLLASLVTAHLRDAPLDTARPGWEDQLDQGVDTAFDRALTRLPALERQGHELPGAARELLTALAWAYGAGFPDDVWPVAASALATSCIEYTREDVYELLGLARRWVVESGESGRAVYRLAHQRLARHLRPRATGVAGDPSFESAESIRLSHRLVRYARDWLQGGAEPESHAYLWQYLWQHGLDAGQQGIDSMRELAATYPAFVPNLARALKNLGKCYVELGRSKEALAPTKEAVALYREQGAANPAFVPDLARALTNLGKCYGELGRRQEALAPTEEAVILNRELAAANPAFEPNLALALNNLGAHYSELGRRREALALTEEAVALYREQATANPAFVPELARTLANLGIHYGKLGRRQEALALTEEAVVLSREQAAANPVFVPNLARALTNLGIRYRALDRRQEALVPTEEAVVLFRDLAAANAAFVPDLARTLANLGVHYGELGRRQEALAPTEEAVVLYRDLAAANPAFVPNLARALANLGVHYGELGRHQEALTPTEEAVALSRTLAAASPAFVPDLARALTNLGFHYSAQGRKQEALAPTEAAVALYREQVTDNPAFLPDLARALTNLAICYSDLGRHQEALAPTEEALALYRELAAANPAFVPNLAVALNNLGNRYSALDRPQEALTPYQEAVALYHKLAATNPAFQPNLEVALDNLDTLKQHDIGSQP